VYNIFDDVTARAKVQKFPEGEKQVVWTGDLPDGFTNVLSGVDKDGKPVKLKPLVRSNGAKYFEIAPSPFYLNDKGSRYSAAEIDNAFKSQSKFKNKDEFLAELDRKGFKQQKELIGANGRGTAQSTVEA